MQYISHSYGKGKSRYSIFGNLWYTLKSLWEWKKSAVLIILLVFIPSVAGSYAQTLLPSVVVQDLEEGAGLAVLVIHIVGICLVRWIGNTCDYAANLWFERSMPSFLQFFRKKFTAKIMDLDYDRLEDGPSRETIGNVAAALRYGRGLYGMPDLLIGGSSCLILLTFYGILIARVGLSLPDGIRPFITTVLLGFQFPGRYPLWKTDPEVRPVYFPPALKFYSVGKFMRSENSAIPPDSPFPFPEGRQVPA